MVTKSDIEELKRIRNKLRSIHKKQEAQRREKLKLNNQAMRLKKEISRLKASTRKDFASKIKRKLKDPKFRRNAKNKVKTAKKGLNRFLDNMDKLARSIE